jgi:hypothetical protein
VSLEYGFDGQAEGAEKDASLEQALRNFKAAVHAWGETELNRPRMVAKSVPKRSWRLAAVWALGCVLAAGGIGGGVYEHHQRLEMARIAAARAAEQRKMAAAEQARKDEEDLLAKVDSDVSREVPSAMEPLAQLMADDGSQ